MYLPSTTQTTAAQSHCTKGKPVSDGWHTDASHTDYHLSELTVHHANTLHYRIAMPCIFIIREGQGHLTGLWPTLELIIPLSLYA